MIREQTQHPNDAARNGQTRDLYRLLFTESEYLEERACRNTRPDKVLRSGRARLVIQNYVRDCGKLQTFG